MRDDGDTGQAARAQTRERVLALAKRRDELHAEQGRLRAEFIEAIPEAKAAGWRMADIARMAGMTRKAVYDALNEALQRSPGSAATLRGPAAQEVPHEQRQQP
jgi:DNA-binding phage protein